MSKEVRAEQLRAAQKAKAGASRRGRQGGFGGPGSPGAMMRGDKPKDFKGTLKKLLRYLGSHKIAIVIVMLFAIASTVFSILGPKILGEATTTLFEGIVGQVAGTGSGPDFGAIAGILLTTLGLYVI
ncbi:MAG: hypothetical protein LBG97_07800, partial [Coriobacteriales bacterium]|nr:hypothetical protein [Coriobacteriales bacterium]